MFSEYKKQVLSTYKVKRKKGTLSLNLLRPTPARLKRECLDVLSVRTNSGDLKTLSDFFGHNKNKENYAHAIKRLETDRFRPLANLLIGKVSKPDDKNIELLAWLIDYPDRPYKYQSGDIEPEPFEDSSDVNSMIELSDEEVIKIEGGKTQSGTPEKVPERKASGTEWMKDALKLKKPLAAGIVILLLGTAGISLKRPAMINNLFSPSTFNACMYWEGEKYLAIPCGTKTPNTLVVAADQDRLNDFKQITDLNSITESDIGRVWYYKVHRDEVEFYTTSGTHPDFPNKHLKPMTKHMYDKYVRPSKK